MTGKRASIGVKPNAAERWVAERPPSMSPKGDQYSARLTIDVTPALRARLKLAAFGRCLTVTKMLRELLEERFPPSNGAELPP
jgi:hypothetical protein